MNEWASDSSPFLQHSSLASRTVQEGFFSSWTFEEQAVLTEMTDEADAAAAAYPTSSRILFCCGGAGEVGAIDTSFPLQSSYNFEL